MPRIKDPIWKKFNEIQLANGSTRGECPICKATVVGLVSRLKAHYEACSRKRSNNEKKIVGGASSSGGLERHFSSLGFSYGTLRAQLGIEKAGKLAFLYRELNQ